MHCKEKKTRGRENLKFPSQIQIQVKFNRILAEQSKGEQVCEYSLHIIKHNKRNIIFSSFMIVIIISSYFSLEIHHTFFLLFFFSFLDFGVDKWITEEIREREIEGEEECKIDSELAWFLLVWVMHWYVFIYFIFFIYLFIFKYICSSILAFHSFHLSWACYVLFHLSYSFTISHILDLLI